MNLAGVFSGTPPLASSFFSPLLASFQERAAGNAPISSLLGLFDDARDVALMSGPAPPGADAATASQTALKLALASEGRSQDAAFRGAAAPLVGLKWL